MGTGACGTDCSLCKLFLHGLCSGCGSGVSIEGLNNLRALVEKFGVPCGVLECALEKKIAFCPEDCAQFPCEKHEAVPCPQCKALMNMQCGHAGHHHHAHHHEHPEAELAPIEAFWELLRSADEKDICRNARVQLSRNGGYLLKSLSETWEILPREMKAEKISGDPACEWDIIFPFFMLVYLMKSGIQCPSGRMVAPRDVLKGREFFTGRHSIQTSEMEKRFGNDPRGFIMTGLALGGMETDNGDASIMLDIFPKLQVEYILWLADDEFPARVTVLLDSEARNLYPLDASEHVINILNNRYILSSQNYM